MNTRTYPIERWEPVILFALWFASLAGCWFLAVPVWAKVLGVVVAFAVAVWVISLSEAAFIRGHQPLEGEEE